MTDPCAALYNLVCLLESSDPAVFVADYDDQLPLARRRVLP